MKPLFFIPWLILPVIAGCQSLSYHDPMDNPRSIPPVGTVIELHQTLTVHPGTSRAYVQNGEAQSSGGIYERRPWCQFYLYEPQEALKKQRTIEPDRFIVSRAFQRSDLVSAFPVDVASSTIFGSFGEGGVSAMTLATTMKLHSEKQPQVVELKCAVFDDPYHYNFVSVNKVIEILGGVATLEFN